MSIWDFMLFQDLSIYRRISSKTSVKYLIEEKISFYSGSYECSFIKSRYIIAYICVGFEKNSGNSFSCLALIIANYSFVLYLSLCKNLAYFIIFHVDVVFMFCPSNIL